MDSSNSHHPYIDRMASASQQVREKHPLSSTGSREMYGSDIPSHTLRFSSMQSGSGLLDSSDMFNERHLQYHGLMQPAYASSSLPSSQGVLYRDYYSHPVNDFNEQYNRLQQARKQQQMKTQSEALHKQQQTFALRQKLNPPLSRQASAMNLNQSHISTQTTSSVQCSPTLNQPTSSMLMPQSFASPRESPRPEQLPLQHYQQQLFRALQNDLRHHLHTQNASTTDENPFSDDIRTERELGTQSPVHQTLVYKGEPLSSSSAASSPTKLLKSPKTKRQPSSLVTFSGWLYKQGSDGLRVWRKRWFVLADYCLFYYKGPEEDRLLGSILLPSYVLSECLPHENKAYRKFSFKLEHKNMRTYYLASENADYMRKWMRVIRAATLMQNFNEVQMRQMIAQSTAVNSTSHSARSEDPDAKDLSYGNPSHCQSYTKVSNTAAPFQNYFQSNQNINPLIVNNEQPNECQPLYANAPPKPRRTHNDVEYSTFATDMLFPYRSEYNPADATLGSGELQPETITPKNGSNRMLSEYEEIYNAQENQLKNMSLNLSYGGESKTLNRPKPRSYTLNDGNIHEFKFNPNTYQHSTSMMMMMPPRPRSADFLEYESKKQMRKMANFGGGTVDPFSNRLLPSRPKSSLDINSSVDNYYYSEASYAAKMRQSALYLQSRNVMRPLSASKDEFNRNTLRYENERKRLTSEFQSYTAAAAAANQSPSRNTDSLPLNFQRGVSDLRSTDEWKLSPMKRKGVYRTDERSIPFRDDVSSSQSFFNTKAFSGEASVSSPSTPDKHFAADLQSYSGSGTFPKTSSSRKKSHQGDCSDQSSIWNPDISAGALLSKTHEELILLLIQLRRQNDAKERAMKRGYSEIEAIQERLSTGSNATSTNLELMSRLEILREQMNTVEKQYEKNKPLVNLVDNMVKLGALYRTESLQWNDNPMMASKDNLNRLHANQRNQERFLIADDQNEWNKYNSRQIELHQKVQQLYELDEILQEESDNLHLLQRDKEDIEGALAELNRKFATDRVQLESFVDTQKVQHSLEVELSKIHNQLAINSRKLEQTVSGNSRLERELLVLRQKLQASRGSGKSLKMSHQATSANDCTADAFDSELRKVQSMVGDMQRQRQELSFAVNQLTLNSNTFADSVKSSSIMLPAHKSTTNTLPPYLNKRLQSNWTETDLDSMYSKNYGSQLLDTTTSAGDLSDISRNSSYHSQAAMEAMHARDAVPEYEFASNDLFPYQDKQEIKTVRIVKRESERRQRDKDKSGGPLIGSNAFDHIAGLQTSDELNEYLSTAYTGSDEVRIDSHSEDDALMSDDELCMSPSMVPDGASFMYGRSMGHCPQSNARVESALKNISIDCNAGSSSSSSAPLTDQFRSNTARQIHNELYVTGPAAAAAPSNANMSQQQLTDMAKQYKRNVPRKKKRHNTAPNSVHNEIFNDYLTTQNAPKQNNYRARDDLDMEVALRTNMSNIAGGAPDIVRSALGQSNDYLWSK